MKTELLPGGAVRVVNETVNPAQPGNAAKGIDPTPASPAADVWHCNDADQAEKHLATWTDAKRPASAVISPGDASAIRDAANEYRKQRKS